MRIGFDAKRLFYNRSGLGNYSRSTVALLAENFAGHDYLLFTPKLGNAEKFDMSQNMQTVLPGRLGRLAPSVWRSYAMSGSIRREHLDLYHGLSNELPYDIARAGVPSVVTIHDLIFVRHPELYKPADVALYRQKYGHSCRAADRIIAISNQTRDDLINFWNISGDKIDVVYQGCNPMFYEKMPQQQKDEVKARYGLPDNYILSVGSIEERKNLLLTVKAMVEGRIDADLVVCGKHTAYTDKVMSYAVAHGIAHRIHLLHNVVFSDLPAIYQMCRVLVYASIFEGFGIPILEGLNSGVPVITSAGGVFPETGGDACVYVDSYSVDSMIDALKLVLSDESLRADMVKRGYAYAERFREHHVAANLMDVYQKIAGR